MTGSSISLCDCHATSFILGLFMGCALLFDIRMVCCRSCSGVNMQVPTCSYVCTYSYVCLTPLFCYHSQTLNICLRKFFTCFWSVCLPFHSSFTVMSFPIIPFLLLLSFFFPLLTSSFSFISSSHLLRFTPIISSFSLVNYSNVLSLSIFQLFTTPSFLTVPPLSLNTTAPYYSH